jgi:hypothetical protein
MDSTIFQKIRDNPCVMDELSPRLYVELVAELLAFFGWEISLTTRTRDGGRDILGVTRDRTGFETTWVVECKHYSRDRKVGVEAVRQLYGVRQGIGAHQAILITSSFLSRDARAFINMMGGVQIADRDTILGWIAQYEPSVAGRAHLPAARFSSCFVSYSSRDEAFVHRFVLRLRGEGVRVWFAPEDLAGGKKIHEEIKDGIDRFDRLLIVLSASSMKSEWVKTEIKNARRREVRDARRVLFPVSLVSFDKLREWELFDADLGQDLASELREYFVPDFSDWNDDSMFEVQFAKVMAGLRTA